MGEPDQSPFGEKDAQYSFVQSKELWFSLLKLLCLSRKTWFLWFFQMTFTEIKQWMVHGKCSGSKWCRGLENWGWVGIGKMVQFKIGVGTGTQNWRGQKGTQNWKIFIFEPDKQWLLQSWCIEIGLERLQKINFVIFLRKTSPRRVVYETWSFPESVVTLISSKLWSTVTSFSVTISLTTLTSSGLAITTVSATEVTTAG